jgi:hypothetical protein
MLDTGVQNQEFTSRVEDDFRVLSENLGIDVPDKPGDLLPYLGEHVTGIRLLLDIIAVERDLRGADLTDRQRVHALRALSILSRFGASAVLVQVGGAAGSVLPGPGSVLGFVIGASAAAGLNRHLKPRYLAVAMRLAGVSEDDLFYFKNKAAIDKIGASLSATMADY